MALTITNKVYLGKAVPDSGGSAPVIDELNVTPSTSPQQITATGGTDGYSPVNVSAVTSSIDANIVAGNIKKDVQILGVTGSYEGTVPTGTVNITSNGTHNVSSYEYAEVLVPTTAPAHYIEKAVDANGKLINGSTIISLTGVTDIGSYVCYYTYYNATGLTGAANFSSLTTISGTYACQNMFQGCTGINSVDLSSLSVISGSNACNGMYNGCIGLTSINLDSLEFLRNSYTCQTMFYGCTGLTTISLPSLRNVFYQSSCSSMFQNCTGLTSFSLPVLTAITGQQGCSSMFYGCRNLTSATLPSLIMLTGQQGCYRMFYNCSGLTNAVFSKLYKLGTNYQLQQTFYGCTSLTSLSFPSLAYTTTSLDIAFTNMLQGVTGCTVHFPAEWQTDMSSWSNVMAGFGGTNTTVLFDLPNVTTLDLSGIKDVIDVNYGNFANNNYFPNITSVDLSGLTLIDAMSGCQNMFNGCSNISSIDVSSLTEITNIANSACVSMFEGTGITNVSVSSLKTVSGYNCCQNMFKNCTNLTTVSFPALKTLGATTMFTNMLNGTTNVTAHFPSNMSSSGITASTLSGTGTTVLFDLPATNILTGTDTKEYERNPKYDTATALAWRINGTMPNTTTYYTSGLTDPTVGTTIYSDSACTIAETTVDSIA